MEGEEEDEEEEEESDVMIELVVSIDELGNEMGMAMGS